jgi:hypothetical protein
VKIGMTEKNDAERCWARIDHYVEQHASVDAPRYHPKAFIAYRMGYENEGCKAPRDWRQVSLEAAVVTYDPYDRFPQVRAESRERGAQRTARARGRRGIHLKMARNLCRLAVVATMLLSTTPALPRTFCKLATVRSGGVEYTFDRSEGDIWWQTRFTKDAWVNSKWYGHWRGKYFVVSPEDAPDWALLLGPYPIPLEGLAPVTLMQGGREMGSGTCVYEPPLTPVYAPPPPARVPDPAHKDSVPIIFFDGGHSVRLDAQVGSEGVRFVVDTGATESSIPMATALSLVAKGEAEWLQPRQYRIADGSSVTMQRVRIHRFAIGNHVLTDVEASASNGSPLLGFDVLNMVGRFTIDTRNHEIVFGGSS